MCEGLHGLVPHGCVWAVFIVDVCMVESLHVILSVVLWVGLYHRRKKNCGLVKVNVTDYLQSNNCSK